jgi:hypothetical protein
MREDCFPSPRNTSRDVELASRSRESGPQSAPGGPRADRVLGWFQCLTDVPVFSGCAQQSFPTEALRDALPKAVVDRSRHLLAFA